MEWEEVKCDFCGSKKLDLFLENISPLENEEKFNLVKCHSCGLIFVNPRPKEQEISKYYSSKTYWGDKDITKIDALPPSWKKKRDESYKELYQEIFKLIPSVGKILDIGCGTGGFLTAFQEKGWQVLGTDLSFEATSYSKRVYGFPVKAGDFQDLDFNQEKFDVVVLNNVLEHLYFPKETLIKIREILVKNGLLIVSVPNIESLGFTIFKRNWYHLEVPRHLYHFSPKTLTNILKKTGYIPVKVDYNSWLHNFYGFFESFRRQFSPKFKKEKTLDVKPPHKSSQKSLKSVFIKKTGIIVDSLFSFFMAKFGALVKKGEIVTFYARKP